MARTWSGEATIQTRGYVCGYCGFIVSPDKGAVSQDQSSWYIYYCSRCKKPTFFDGNQNQVPGPMFGEGVQHVPTDIDKLYNEARKAVSVQAYTAAVLACRKVLMNVAVSLQAPEGQSFASYVEYLSNLGYIPPNGKHWVDHIRTKSNEANHEIALMSQEEAQRLITFVQMLLTFIYELPKGVPTPSTP